MSACDKPLFQAGGSNSHTIIGATHLRRSRETLLQETKELEEQYQRDLEALEGKVLPRLHSILQALLDKKTPITPDLIAGVHIVACNPPGRQAKIVERYLAIRLKDDPKQAYEYLEQAVHPSCFAYNFLLAQKETHQLTVFKALMSFFVRNPKKLPEKGLTPQEQCFCEVFGLFKVIEEDIFEEQSYTKIANLIKDFPKGTSCLAQTLERFIAEKLKDQLGLACTYYRCAADPSLFSRFFFLQQTKDAQKDILMKLMKQEIATASQGNPLLRASSFFVKVWRVHASVSLNLNDLCSQLVDNAEKLTDNYEGEHSFFEKGLKEIFGLTLPDSLTDVLTSFYKKLDPTHESVVITHTLIVLRYINAAIYNEAGKQRERRSVQERLISLAKLTQTICNNDCLPDRYHEVAPLFLEFREQYIPPPTS